MGKNSLKEGPKPSRDQGKIHLNLPKGEMSLFILSLTSVTSKYETLSTFIQYSHVKRYTVQYSKTQLFFFSFIAKCNYIVVYITVYIILDIQVCPAISAYCTQGDIYYIAFLNCLIPCIISKYKLYYRPFESEAALKQTLL